MTAVKDDPRTATEERAVQRDTLPGPPKRRWPLLWLAALAAIVVAGALFLVLSGDDDAATQRTTPGSAPSGMPMVGGSTASRGAASTVNVELGEMYVKPSVDTVEAGRITFVARNVGRVEHELMVERMPIKMDAPGMPTEDAAIGMIEEMPSMQRGRMTLRLTPGEYELFCNVQGHYAAGQRTTLTVTGS